MITCTKTYHLGKGPARPNAVKLKFSSYAKSSLPKPPASFGHENLVGSSAWGMLGNDTVGDCVIAGAMHETMLWNAEASNAVTFTEANAISTYSAITGYKPGKPNTDNGTDMQVAAKYRQKTGIKDASGRVHKIGAYLALTPGDLAQQLQAAWIFGAVGIGIEFPASAMDQFNAGKPWDVVKGSKVEGGHYVPLIANRGNLEIVTWGRVQAMTPKFFEKYCDEAIVYLSTELIGRTGLTLEGFNLAALRDDLTEIQKESRAAA